MAAYLLRRPFPSIFFSPSRMGFNPWLAPHRFLSASNHDNDAVRLSANERLKRVIDSKIRRVKIFPIPEDSPFHLSVDESRNCGPIVILKRNILGEKITVVVFDHLYQHWEEKANDNENDGKEDNLSDFDDDYTFDLCDYSSYLDVEIDKGNGRYLKFNCCSFDHAYPLEFVVESMHLGFYRDSDEEDSDVYRILSSSGYGGVLGGEMEKAATKFLAARGIDRSLAKLAEDYYKNENRLYHINWLNKVKDFLTI